MQNILLIGILADNIFLNNAINCIHGDITTDVKQVFVQNSK